MVVEAREDIDDAMASENPAASSWRCLNKTNEDNGEETGALQTHLNFHLL